MTSAEIISGSACYFSVIGYSFFGHLGTSGSTDPCTFDPTGMDCCITQSVPSEACCAEHPDLSGCPAVVPPTLKKITVKARASTHHPISGPSSTSRKVSGLKDGYCVDVEFRYSGRTSTGFLSELTWGDRTKTVCTDTTFSTQYALDEAGIIDPDVNNWSPIVRLFLKSPEGSVVKSEWCNDGAGSSYCTIEYEY